MPTTEEKVIVPPEYQGRCSFSTVDFARDQGAYAGGVAEHLVERETDEVGAPPTEVEPVGGDERRRVQQHIPALRVRLRDPLQRVLHTGEVRLRRIGEKMMRAGTGQGEAASELGLIGAQIQVAPRGCR